MMPRSRAENPLDKALTERLHLSPDARLALSLVRGAIGGYDALSRLFTGRPFFGLRESEEILRKLDGLQGQELIEAVLRMEGGTHIEATGTQHVPDAGPVVIASTHPTGIFDFVAHAAVLLELRPDLKVVANQETEAFLGRDLIIPVVIDRENRTQSGSETMRGMLDHLKSGGALLIFGSGRVPDKKDGRLVEPPWRRGTTRVSAASGAPVIPAALNAANSSGYYRTRAIARTLSGGNDNFGAMIASLRYLEELLDKLGGRYDVHYSSPLPPGTAPEDLKHAAEGLVPRLYDGPAQSSNSSL